MNDACPSQTSVYSAVLVRHWKDVSSLKCPELQVVLLEGREKEGAPMQSILPLPVHQYLNHKRWRRKVLKVVLFCKSIDSCFLSLLIFPLSFVFPKCAYRLGPRLPCVAVCGRVWLHPGLPEDDWWLCDAGPSRWPNPGPRSPAAPQKTPATLTIREQKVKHCCNPVLEPW